VILNNNLRILEALKLKYRLAAIDISPEEWKEKIIEIF